MSRANGDHGERISSLEVEMEDLMGNGQPGRVKELERKVEGHTKLIWIGMGVLFALQFLSANGALTFSKLIAR